MTDDPARMRPVEVLPARCGSDIARGLRLWRALHRVKQAHAAELLGVSQGQVSRWEGGRQAPGPLQRRAIVALLTARLTSGADARLARFVRESACQMHLVCDVTHRLMAWSGPRARTFLRDPAELAGRSLWGSATEDIVRAEGQLDAEGWFELAAPSLTLRTRAQRGPLVDIAESTFSWTRFRLSDGSHARLVETLEAA